MKLRAALVPAALVAGLLVPGASAAAPPACNTISDPKGDTFAIRLQDGQGAYGPQEDALDVVSADLASDGKVVTAAIRLASFSRAIATSPQGFSVGLDFLIGSSTDVVRLQAVLVNGDSDRFEVSAKAADAVPNSPSTFVAAVTGVVDDKKSEIRISAPAEVLAAYGALKPGTKLIPNEAESATVARGVPALTTTPGAPMTTRGPFADIAAGGKTVAVGTKSCVVPGK
jgi:hypothetical protein